MNPVAVIARKEAGELLASPRGLAWLLAMGLVLSAFCLLLVGSTELSLLDNAEVVYDMCGITTALGALLAVVIGTDTIAGERERGSLVPLLVTPTSRGAILWGKLAGIAAAWLTMFTLALPYFWAVGSTGQNLLDGAFSVALLGTPVVLGFGFLAMGLGARMPARASLMICLVVLLLSASPVLLGPSLRQSAIGRIFDWLNPFSAALNAFDAVIIDSLSPASQWASGMVTLAWAVLTLGFAHNSLRRVTQ